MSHSPFLRFVRYWVPLLLYGACIFFLSHQSDLPSIPGEGFDKVSHFIEYALLGVLLVRAMTSHQIPSRRALAWAVMFAVGYGISDEIHQMFTPNRRAELGDLLADFLGASAGGLFWLYLQRPRPYMKNQ